MSDFTLLELLKGHARICPPQSLERYNKGMALIQNGRIEEGRKILSALAYDQLNYLYVEDDDDLGLSNFYEKLSNLLSKGWK